MIHEIHSLKAKTSLLVRYIPVYEYGGLQPHEGSNSVNRPERLPPRAPREWTTKQRVYMERPMTLATYVAEDSLVGHQWEESPLGLRRFDVPV